MVAFGGEVAEPRELRSYFPYPDWQPAGTAAPTQPGTRPSRSTEDVLRRLFAQRRIPPHVFRALSEPPRTDP